MCARWGGGGSPGQVNVKNKKITSFYAWSLDEISSTVCIYNNMGTYVSRDFFLLLNSRVRMHVGCTAKYSFGSFCGSSSRIRIRPSDPGDRSSSAEDSKTEAELAGVVSENSPVVPAAGNAACPRGTRTQGAGSVWRGASGDIRLRGLAPPPTRRARRGCLRQ